MSDQAAICHRYLLGKGISVFSSRMLLGISTTLLGKPHSGVVGQNKTDFMVFSFYFVLLCSVLLDFLIEREHEVGWIRQEGRIWKEFAEGK